MTLVCWASTAAQRDVVTGHLSGSQQSCIRVTFTLDKRDYGSKQACVLSGGRSGERTFSRTISGASNRSSEGASGQAIERSSERSIVRPIDRVLERTLERANERAIVIECPSVSLTRLTKLRVKKFRYFRAQMVSERAQCSYVPKSS